MSVHGHYQKAGPANVRLQSLKMPQTYKSRRERASKERKKKLIFLTCEDKIKRIHRHYRITPYPRITPTQQGGLYRPRFHKQQRVVTSNFRCKFYICRCISDVNLAPVASCVVGIYSIEINILWNYPHLYLSGSFRIYTGKCMKSFHTASPLAYIASSSCSHHPWLKFTAYVHTLPQLCTINNKLKIVR